MSDDKTGGPAFPARLCSWTDSDGIRRYEGEGGMTLRDYFAGQAMRELAATWKPDDGAERAYEWADAMLKARQS